MKQQEFAKMDEGGTMGRVAERMNNASVMGKVVDFARMVIKTEPHQNYTPRMIRWDGMEADLTQIAGELGVNVDSVKGLIGEIAKELNSTSGARGTDTTATGHSQMRSLQDHIDEVIAEHVLFTTKEILTTQEAARYMGVSTSQLYKLTSRREIPHYKPNGKLCFFKRADLDAWMLNNRISTATELADRASALSMKGGAR